jgi:hypothetical protein
VEELADPAECVLWGSSWWRFSVHVTWSFLESAHSLTSLSINPLRCVDRELGGGGGGGGGHLTGRSAFRGGCAGGWV